MLHFFLSSLVGDRDSVSDRTMPSGTLKWQASLVTDGILLFSSSDTKTYSACVKFCVCTECAFKFVYFLFKCIFPTFLKETKEKSNIETVYKVYLPIFKHFHIFYENKRYEEYIDYRF